MNAKPTALDAYLARTDAIHAKLERLQKLASPDCKPAKGLRVSQALSIAQISRWPFCRFSPLKSPEGRVSTGRKRGDRFSTPRV